jgi:hypothetical protein
LVLKNKKVHFDGLGLKTIGGGFASRSSKPGMDNLVVCASKPSAAGLTSLGLKNQGVADRRTHVVISKFASSQSNVEKALGSLTWGYLVRVLHVRKT